MEVYPIKGGMPEWIARHTIAVGAHLKPPRPVGN